MKTVVILIAITATLVQSPAILTKKVRVPVPTVIYFKKRTGKFF